MRTKDYLAALKEIGVSYIGNVSQSAKLVKNETKHVLTYGIYLAPWTLASGAGLKINTCPAGQHCHKSCLNGSGHNKIDILSGHNRIESARIAKTRMFYQNREKFVKCVCHEIDMWKRRADAKGFGFSVRLNCTSDLSPKTFRIGGKCILDIYPDVQFYDYTKVANRVGLMKEFKNYHLTFSHDGYNWDTCVDFLNAGINVAVVFESGIMPRSFRGYTCIDMTQTDLRYIDPTNYNKGFIGYLEYHKTANDYVGGVYHRPDTPFVIKEDDPDCLYQFQTPKSTEWGE